MSNNVRRLILASVALGRSAERVSTATRVLGCPPSEEAKLHLDALRALVADEAEQICGAPMADLKQYVLDALSATVLGKNGGWDGPACGHLGTRDSIGGECAECLAKGGGFDARWLVDTERCIHSEDPADCISCMLVRKGRM